MWIFTTRGPMSVTAGRSGEGLHLKGRRRADLEQIVAPEAVYERDGDYPFHASLSREELKTWLSEEVDRIDYTNFKGSLSDDLYPVYLRIWFVMLEAFGGFGRK